MAGLILLAGLILSAPVAQAMIDNVIGKTWTRAAYDGHPIDFRKVITFNNKIWGHDDGRDESHSMILSSEEGVIWQQITDSAPFGCNDHTLIDFQGKLWALPSYAQHPNESQNTWVSDDGLSWTLASSNQAPATLVPILVHQNKLWGFGYYYSYGQYGGVSFDHSALLYSADGKTWTQATQAEPFTTRGSTAMVSFAGKLWLLGGTYQEIPGVSRYLYKNDVWSSDDGIHWTQRVSSAAWSPRSCHTAIVFDNKIWLMSGFDADGTYLHDIWRSSDGINWTQVTPTDNWEPEPLSSSFIFADRIWVFQGWFGSFPLHSSAPMPTGTPLITSIGEQRAQEKIPFTAPEPVLDRGSRPITWSLVKAPAGMSIDSESGIASWPEPTLAGSPQMVTIRATNADGYSDVTWKLTVIPQNPAVLRAPTWSAGSQCTVSWTTPPNVSGYILQRDDAPDFKTPLQTLTLPASTLQYTFKNLPDNRTFWYRVMGRKTGGLTSAWSTVVSCTRDATGPRGAIKINGGATSTNSYLITLSLSSQDPGTHPSGVAQMRFSRNGLNWSDWEPYAAKKTYKLAPEGLNQRIYVQFQDQVGNLSSPVAAGIQCLAKPTCVDYGNTSGPWLGTPAKPYRHIQDAINGARAGAYIYVAHGTYPDFITLKSGLTLLGGFDQGRFTLATRNLQINTTITAPPITDEARKTVRLDGVTTVTLEGLNITQMVPAEGRSGDGVGCGLYCRNVNKSCLISHCSIVGNTAVLASYEGGHIISGGGIYLDGASPIISNCLIANNRANNGGGIYCLNSSPLITNSRIQNNTTSQRQIGGGSFIGYVGGHGGGIYTDGSSPVIQNCIISDNSGIGIESPAKPITNCTIKNCIIWGNKGGPLSYNCSTPTYSDIQDWTGGGTGNIALNPQFTTDGTFHLQITSPCIDAGGFVQGLTTDLDGRPRPIKRLSPPRGDGSGFDIGAFEY